MNAVAKVEGHDSEGGCGRGEKDSRHCAHCCRNNHTSDKCWDKFRKHEWTQIADTTSTSTSAATSSTAASTVQIFQSDYECFLQLQTAQATQPANTTMHGFVSGTSAFVTSLHKPCVLIHELHSYDKY